MNDAQSAIPAYVPGIHIFCYSIKHHDELIQIHPFYHLQYDATKPGKFGGGGEYDVQDGFGWTNGVVLEFLDTYPEASSTSEPVKPPYGKSFNRYLIPLETPAYTPVQQRIKVSMTSVSPQRRLYNGLLQPD